MYHWARYVIYSCSVQPCLLLCKDGYRSVRMYTALYACVLLCTHGYRSLRMCTALYACIPLCTHVYRSVRMCAAVYACVLLCTHVYRTALYPRVPLGTPTCTALYPCVPLCSPMCTSLYLCVPLFTHVYRSVPYVFRTAQYAWLALSTHVYRTAVHVCVPLCTMCTALYYVYCSVRMCTAMFPCVSYRSPCTAPCLCRPLSAPRHRSVPLYVPPVVRRRRLDCIPLCDPMPQHVPVPPGLGATTSRLTTTSK